MVPHFINGGVQCQIHRTHRITGRIAYDGIGTTDGEQGIRALPKDLKFLTIQVSGVRIPTYSNRWSQDRSGGGGGTWDRGGGYGDGDLGGTWDRGGGYGDGDLGGGGGSGGGSGGSSSGSSGGSSSGSGGSGGG